MENSGYQEGEDIIGNFQSLTNTMNEYIQEKCHCDDGTCESHNDRKIIEDIKRTQRETRFILDNGKPIDMESYNRGVEDSKQKVEKSFEEFNLWDWSGESEVYAEIDKLKVQTIDNISKLLNNK